MQPQYYSLQPYPPFAFPHAAPGYPMMPGQMLPPPTSSGTETDGESAPAGAAPPTTTAASHNDGESVVDEGQVNHRRKRKSGTGASGSGKDDQGEFLLIVSLYLLVPLLIMVGRARLRSHGTTGSSRRAGKRATANGTDHGAGNSSLISGTNA